VPVLKVPVAKEVPPPPSIPTTVQEIVVLFGQGESGLQVITVSPALQAKVTGMKGVDGVLKIA
jgi:hypothetical protein